MDEVESTSEPEMTEPHSLSLTLLTVNYSTHPWTEMRSTTLAIYLAALALRASAFDCALTASGIQYDLKPLGGIRTATHTSSTPPTSNEARVLMNLCGDIGSEDGVSDEDKVSLSSMD